MALTEINSKSIKDGDIVNADIADDTIAEAKLDISNTASDGQFLQYKDSSDKLTWASVTSTPEGTAIKSTGETGTAKFLRVDGDNSCSWQVPPDTTTPADDSVTGAKLSVSLVQGDVLYGSGTDTLARLAKGTAGQSLIMNTGATAPEWGDAAAGAGGGGSDKIFWENGQTVTTSYQIGDDFEAACNAMSAGPITINNGVTVTIASGETWTIV